MKLIPVIDLKQSLVVHAQGDRHRSDYQPVCTPYFNDANPIAVVTTLIERLNPTTLYIADLDAIEAENRESTHNTAIIDNIHQHFPHLELWLDTGIQRADQIESQPRITPVIGTETLQDDISLLDKSDYILSLDCREATPLGHDDILQRTDEWPTTTIALSLSSVGTSQGPDYDTLKRIRDTYTGELIAGGGIRNKEDLETLSDLDINSVLAATAIYSGTLL